ncbi:addiction module toxin, RelE/StbE family protein, partial [Vibrio parahaemolyticus 605]
MILWEEESL